MNLEAAVEISGTVKEPVFAGLLAFTKRSVDFGEPVTRDIADRYRLSWMRARRMPKPPHDPIASVASVNPEVLRSDLVNMDWDQYTNAVRSSRLGESGAELRNV